MAQRTSRGADHAPTFDPIPATASATAVFASRTPEESRSAEQNAALALAARLTAELVAADALLFAVPLYNFGVPQHFKAWVDMVMTDPRMAAGAEPPRYSIRSDEEAA